ncbi:carbohydrate binding protein with CBM6 domain [Neolewinella xylanilytica]|uniref:Carbohydrate binding protein with CBM6 domain n=1 Tax=Neolewinella xylanilytica TaxID=1514080 RepID=A0A2S6I8E0_9BACT|nr:cellulase family glycosylhydrolase [Neolewinella xylanilytica]PPK87767.1 carbohydrate binding protein with CBM6 domain [Neolewinella xylanilytica]
MRTWSLFLFLVGGSFSLLAQPATYLRADATRILNGEGEEVIFRGIGLGGWMLQEGYMLKTGGPQYKIERRIEDLVGAERKDRFYDAWLANHTQRADVEALAGWGFNLIRLPMHYKLFTPPIEEEPVAGEVTWRERGFELTDSLLAWCQDNGMYLILDLHAAPGGQGENADINDYDPTKPSLWESEANREKTIALWRRLAERYADEPAVAGYDIINEPNWGFQNHEEDPNGCAETENTILWELQRDITAAIREVDPNHIVIIEGNCWGNNYRGLPELWDDNLVVSFHKYWNPNDRASIQHMLDMREERQVPIWLGETGENSNTWFTDAISLFEENDFGWAWWPLKKLGYNNPLQIPLDPGYQDLIDYWRSPDEVARPDPDTAFAALMQFAENTKFENNIQHPSVVDAMIRQPHSDAAIPFAKHTLGGDTTTYLPLTDFDLGRAGIAYSDTEVDNTTTKAGGQAWNYGSAYRNDGVDIRPAQDERGNGYAVGWTEAGEWLQYTVEVATAGDYRVAIRAAATDPGAAVRLDVDGTTVTEAIPLPATGSGETWRTTPLGTVRLDPGTQVIRLHVATGGADLNWLSFERAR